MPFYKAQNASKYDQFLLVAIYRLTPSKDLRSFDTKENIVVYIQLDHTLPCSSNRWLSNLVSISLDIVPPLYYLVYFPSHNKAYNKQRNIDITSIQNSVICISVAVLWHAEILGQGEEWEMMREWVFQCQMISAFMSCLLVMPLSSVMLVSELRTP